ncbi:MAG: adenylyl-sulfate reductase subunit alpha [Lachnospiraceae bacterium]|uniref:Adenylyl-sulfate reductase subunit alpha n=1 Tax=Candidatus Weimeria bifida TaxID=2599074 RepID=A0A6N7IZT9_9FIRM|nr:adenylyl-sulfate reductase subunit alpha [Candidatus Weimeria bifida]RRF96604.1 MAG: adenylyl-sulfate reductase subunit alpha [Lachnospiraceae bacterium]
MKIEKLNTDVLIIGGGTAGCYAASYIGENSGYKVIVAEKADIKRSGCLAAGVNALNAYISDGHTPGDYVEYARKDAEGIVRDDLLLTIAEKVNAVTHDLEKKGLVILKDRDGNYVTRGWRNVKINGENIKPILAENVCRQKNVKVINHINITDLKKSGDSVTGAYGFSVREKKFFEIDASAVIIATGGAAGLYRPNNPGFSRHKMWYPPFNTGAGYAMGIRAGAEMTTLENRFVALRCKDTIAPTGTIAQGVHAKQVNSDGEVYETKYGLTTPERIYGTVEEKRAGRGPCYLKTKGISKEAESDLYKAYLNMAPSQTLKWIESGRGPSEDNVEIDGTEPYVVGGHTAGGFWVDTGRRTTVKGLYAAGDVAGGAPQKYVTGALAEGEIAAKTVISDLENSKPSDNLKSADIFKSYLDHFNRTDSTITCEQAEEAMQKTMDEYAGGIGSDYRYNEAGLKIAERRIEEIEKLAGRLRADDMYDLLKIFELKDRLTVCRALIAHLSARKETRWHIFGENADHPVQDAKFLCYVNSVLKDKKIKVIYRPLVKRSGYLHSEAQEMEADT